MEEKKETATIEETRKFETTSEGEPTEPAPEEPKPDDDDGDKDGGSSSES